MGKKSENERREGRQKDGRGGGRGRAVWWEGVIGEGLSGLGGGREGGRVEMSGEQVGV